MSLRKGAETVVNQCLAISEDEKVVIVNDGNDQELVDALMDVLSEVTDDYRLLEYEEPENHGEEPPERIAKALKDSDVFIAPTNKSISHTEARVKACENGARGVTMPGVNREIWETSLQADYKEVKEICEQVYGMLEETDTVHITTPSGTDLEIDIDMNFFHKDTGLFHEPGDFGNLPAGEADGGSINARGTLVVDHAPFISEENEGTELEVRDNKIVSMKAENAGRLEQALDQIEGARNIAEFGFGTNPKTKLIGNLLNDEKVLGTVHVAIGDNGSYIPEEDERHVKCGIHWDFVCKKPTVHFDDEKVLDEGETVFMDQ